MINWWGRKKSQNYLQTYIDAFKKLRLSKHVIKESYVLLTNPDKKYRNMIYLLEVN